MVALIMMAYFGYW